MDLRQQTFGFREEAAVLDSQPGTFGDGTSNTIVFAEHYARCNGTSFHYSSSLWSFTGSHAVRRATFADGGSSQSYQLLDDVHPVTAGVPPSSTPSAPGVTFQVRPPLDECNPLVPQTPHAGGMIVALADGSVRTIAPAVNPSVFWSAVTPAGGEVNTLD